MKRKQDKVGLEKRFINEEIGNAAGLTTVELQLFALLVKCIIFIKKLHFSPILPLLDPKAMIFFISLGWGVFNTTYKELEKGSFVIHYDGELINKEEATKRENEHQKKQSGSYMFYFKHYRKELWLVFFHLKLSYLVLNCCYVEI